MQDLLDDPVRLEGAAVPALGEHTCLGILFHFTTALWPACMAKAQALAKTFITRYDTATRREPLIGPVRSPSSPKPTQRALCTSPPFSSPPRARAAARLRLSRVRYVGLSRQQVQAMRRAPRPAVGRDAADVRHELNVLRFDEHAGADLGPRAKRG